MKRAGYGGLMLATALGLLGTPFLAPAMPQIERRGYVGNTRQTQSKRYPRSSKREEQRRLRQMNNREAAQ